MKDRAVFILGKIALSTTIEPPAHAFTEQGMQQSNTHAPPKSRHEIESTVPSTSYPKLERFEHFASDRVEEKINPTMICTAIRKYIAALVVGKARKFQMFDVVQAKSLYDSQMGCDTAS